jgi:hypothetical protein
MRAQVVIVAARYVPQAESQGVGTSHRRPGELFIAQISHQLHQSLVELV